MSQIVQRQNQNRLHFKRRLTFFPNTNNRNTQMPILILHLITVLERQSVGKMQCEFHVRARFEFCERRDSAENVIYPSDQFPTLKFPWDE